MAKSAAERKAAQRARQAAGGGRKMELVLDEQEVVMLAQNCALRRPQREPYGMDEYITMLIRKDNAELQAQLAEQAKRTCRRCGDTLPGDPAGCGLKGEGACWQTFGWQETKLAL
ncbi:hypothetical protein LLS47_12230 [Rouxiella badensis]|uniref:hypothetical protein n=1 Tax=Rouxiella badensis TaxID=1646377 RepID=UPI001D149F36|nr:hypothetical protein [Rouxiella badensis]MCC3733695.1 hypothetical protein [Rouxiella badensis]MCC3759652.1 hypothetical protein [Rouxiella badensis]